MDTRLRLDKSLQRDSALGCRIGMPGGSAQLSARTVPPLEQVLRWREKAEHDRLHPKATAARKARDARDCNSAHEQGISCTYVPQAKRIHARLVLYHIFPLF